MDKGRKKILGLIPARGGSKGIPGKNIKPLAGKSLIQRTFESAVASGVLDRIILSTDDAEIADHACSIGLETPFLRPAKIASDESPMIDVALHALMTLQEKGYTVEALMILQPTSPLRKPGHIQKAVELLGDNDAVCSVIPVPKHFCPHYLMKITESGFLDYFMPNGAGFTRRQDVPQAYNREGTIFLTRTRIILEQRSFYGNRCLPMAIDPRDSLNIDQPEDWIEAEQRLNEASI